MATLRRTTISLPKKLATAASTLPSPSTSPAATASGSTIVASVASPPPFPTPRNSPAVRPTINRSSRPSPVRSAMARWEGPATVEPLLPAEKPPMPSPGFTVSVLASRFAITRSASSSTSISAITMLDGPLPTEIVVGAGVSNLPSPLLCSQVTLSPSKFAVKRSIELPIERTAPPSDPATSATGVSPVG
jgi:hypothetical protein